MPLNYPLTGNGLVQMIRIWKSTWLKWVNRINNYVKISFLISVYSGQEDWVIPHNV